MDSPFHRLAIVNRGEPAMRAIRAVRELNEETEDPITLIALYTAPEHQAMFVREADEAYSLGGGYLDFRALEEALVSSRADAAWVGWGFVAEHPDFAELCERLGVVFVGPNASAMRLLGDKVAAKRLAEEAGLPVAPWSGGAVGSLEEAIRSAERDRLSAADQGGGRRGRAGDPPGRGAPISSRRRCAAPARRPATPSATTPSCSRS